MEGRHTYRFVVLGRYPARLKGNESHVTVNMTAGEGTHQVACGTLTMSESEWAEFTAALRESLGERVEIDEGPPRERRA